MGITLLTTEIKPKNIKLKCNVGIMCLQKGRQGCEVIKLISCLTYNININFPLFILLPVYMRNER